MDIPRGGMPGLRQRLEALGLPLGRMRVLREALIERAIFAREDVARIWFDIVGTKAPDELAQSLAEGRAIVGGLGRCSEELDAVVHALEGGYIRPAYGAVGARGRGGAA